MLLISNFNLQNCATYLERHRQYLGGRITIAPLGQVTQTLLDATSPLWNPAPSLCLVWTQPEAVLPSFQRALLGHAISRQELEREVDDFVQCLRQATDRTPILLIPTWTLPPDHSGHGLLDLHVHDGVFRLLTFANQRLLANLDEVSGAFALNADRWLQLVGGSAYSPRLWYGAKIPFSNELFKVVAADIAAAVAAIQGRSRKLILLDLDDTLWGGIVGDVGWENLVLGGHDQVGEAFVDFQRELKALARRGIALGILSKNQESVALGAIDSHPEMILRRDDFAGWRINWGDKAQNLADLVRELNLGADSAVFIDDNPVERARIREAFPEVLVPEWPRDKRFYRQALLELDCFQKPRLSAEDRQRVRMYSQDRQRTHARASVTTVEEWLASLQLSVHTSLLNPSDSSRITQLLNKTNQMNLSTRRLTETELNAWASQPGRILWGVRVGDRFGDYGLTGIVSLVHETQGARIVDFVLSCRVMGRKVEETMLHLAVEWARAAGLASVSACYQPTPKNQPCLEFFRRSGFQEVSDGVFSWDTGQVYPLNPHVRLTSIPDLAPPALVSGATTT